jgi:hypothetical protein
MFGRSMVSYFLEFPTYHAPVVNVQVFLSSICQQKEDHYMNCKES